MTPFSMKMSLFQLTVIILTATVFASCSLLPESGPVNIVEDHDDPNTEVSYNIIDVSPNNLNEYNTTQYHHSDKLSAVDPNRTYSDSIQKGDLMRIFIIDPNKDSPFAAGMPIGPLEVSQEGTANLPFIGSLKVEGKTLSQVEDMVKEKFSLKFNTAEVSVARDKKIHFRANVIGQVAQPGQRTINRPDFTLADLISLSGGTRIDPHLCDYKLHRDNKTYTLADDQITKTKTLIQDGDLLEVVKSKYQHLVIMGAVNNPGNHSFPTSHAHLTDLIGSSRGINLSNGDPSGIFIFRRQKNKKTNVYRFNLRKANGLIAASKFHLHGGDVIYVTEAPLSRWNRILRNALPIGQIQGIQGIAN